MHLELLQSGQVDDLGIDLDDVTIERTGEARYVLRAHRSGLEILIWTTRKQRVQVAPWDDEPPAWVVLERAETGELESLRASRCYLHFEQMDRASYFVGLARDAEDDRWGLFLRAHGYLSTRVLRTPEDTSACAPSRGKPGGD